jgi:hypothetical protein
MPINNFLTMTNTPYKYGKKSGPPPKSGPMPQGLNLNYNTVTTVKQSGEKINGRQYGQRRQGLPNEPRKEFEIPGEEEIQEQVVEEVEKEQESLPDDVEVTENEDGSVDINLDPSAATPEGGDEHYANLADFLPDDVLGRLSSNFQLNIKNIFHQEKIGKKLIHKV